MPSQIHSRHINKDMLQEYYEARKKQEKTQLIYIPSALE